MGLSQSGAGSSAAGEREREAMTCDECGGEGSLECDTCDGSGAECQACGRGECETCGGSGFCDKCEACDGTGEIHPAVDAVGQRDE